MHILAGLHSVPRKKRLNQTMVLQLIDTSLQIIAFTSVAEIFRRIFVIFREYLCYKNHYEAEQRLLTIIKRAFNLNNETKVFLIVFGAAFIIRLAIKKDEILPPVQWLPFMLLYWVFIACRVNHSDISNAEWIRQPYGIDYASGMASNYFHGYLKLTLPSHTGHLGIKERIALYEDSHAPVKFALNKLVILIPNTMYVKPKIESKILTKDGVEPLDVVYKYRAGVKRPFKNDIYKFTIPINGTYYYVAMEGATPMLSFFESMNFKPSATDVTKTMQREILFKFYKHLNKLLKEWPETEDEAELIFYNTYKADGKLQDVGEVLLSHITNMWNEGRS